MSGYIPAEFTFRQAVEHIKEAGNDKRINATSTN